MAKSKIERRESASPLDSTWYSERFASGFVYDRPFGTGDELIHFFHFRSDVVLLDSRSEEPREAGSAIVYTPGAPQRFRNTAAAGKTLLCDHVCFPAAAASRLSARGVPLDRCFVISTPQPIVDTILGLRTEERKAQDHWRAVVRAYRTVLILQLAREAAATAAVTRSPRDARREGVIRDVCAMIDRNPAHHWVVAELAQMLNMSRGRFSHLFKQVAGVSPQEYAINARLREACVLLTNTALSVSQIADRCGFRSAYYLSRLFRKRIGCPPSRYAERFHVASD